MKGSLARGQHAEVVLGDASAWRARVVSAFGERVVVAFLTQPQTSPATLVGTVVQLAVTTPRGILRAPAVVLGADAEGLLEVDVTDEGKLDQRREHVRVESRLPSAVEPTHGEYGPLRTYTLDVSGGGVLVAGAGPIELGEPVIVTVKLPERPSVQAIGRVARRTDEGHAGLVFDGIATHAREELVRWIFEQQRLERAAQRERT
jgi:hypothetical protein